MWSLILAAEIVALQPLQPLELGAEPIEITLIAPDDVELRQKLSGIAADPTENLVLRLSSVESDATSSVSWEVLVASSDNSDCVESSSLVGVVSSFGLRPDSEFAFALESSVDVGLPSGLKLIFRPVSGLEEEGKPVPPIVRGSLRIGGISIETERAAGR